MQCPVLSCLETYLNIWHIFYIITTTTNFGLRTGVRYTFTFHNSKISSSPIFKDSFWYISQHFTCSNPSLFTANKVSIYNLIFVRFLLSIIALLSVFSSTNKIDNRRKKKKLLCWRVSFVEKHDQGKYFFLSTNIIFNILRDNTFLFGNLI